MTTQHDAVEVSTRTLEGVVDELQERVTTLEVEVAHWERTCRMLSADLLALVPQRRHCRARRTAHGDGGQSQ